MFETFCNKLAGMGDSLQTHRQIEGQTDVEVEIAIYVDEKLFSNPVILKVTYVSSHITSDFQFLFNK